MVWRKDLLGLWCQLVHHWLSPYSFIYFLQHWLCVKMCCHSLIQHFYSLKLNILLLSDPQKSITAIPHISPCDRVNLTEQNQDMWWGERKADIRKRHHNEKQAWMKRKATLTQIKLTKKISMMSCPSASSRAHVTLIQSFLFNFKSLVDGRNPHWLHWKSPALLLASLPFVFLFLLLSFMSFLSFCVSFPSAII